MSAAPERAIEGLHSPGGAARGAKGSARRRGQRGGFAVGLVVGLLAGLAVALAVALYVTKAPVPFVNKLPQRSAEQDAAETERNKNWDPNAPLAGKTLARAASAAATPSAPAAAALPASAAPLAAAGTAAAPPPAAGRDPAAILAGQGEAAAKPAPRPVAAAPPRATAAASVSSTLGMTPAINPANGPPLQFYVQAGAYARPDDADTQRARVAMLGMAARVMAREQAGRTVYRVRVGPFDERSSAEDSQARLGAAGIEANLVRVER